MTPAITYPNEEMVLDYVKYAYLSYQDKRLYKDCMIVGIINFKLKGIYLVNFDVLGKLLFWQNTY